MFCQVFDDPVLKFFRLFIAIFGNCGQFIATFIAIFCIYRRFIATF